MNTDYLVNNLTHLLPNTLLAIGTFRLVTTVTHSMFLHIHSFIHSFIHSSPLHDCRMQ